MRTITAITASARYPGRWIVEVDGKEVALVALETIDRLRLAIGRPVDTVAEELEREAAAVKTYDRALNMLAARARSSRELERLLLRKGEAPANVEQAITRLTGAGFLDDAAYARQFARSKAAGAGLTKRRVEQELRKRGVDREVAGQAIDDVFLSEELSEEALVDRAAQKKLRSLGSVDPATRVRRLYAYLARRGYSPDQVRAAVARVQRAAAADDASSARPDEGARG